MTHYPTDPVFSDTPVYGTRDSYDAENNYKAIKVPDENVRLDVLSATDWLGSAFRLGDTVMYCIGAGRGQMMALGTVQAIRAWYRKRLVSRDWSVPGDRSRDVYEAYWDVEVQVLTQKTSGAWNNKERTRPAWVNPMNITALPINLTELDQ